MSEEMIAPAEAATFLRNHHIYCTARDGRFNQVAALVERLAPQSAYNPNERLREALVEARRWVQAAHDDRDTGTQPGIACFNALQEIDRTLEQGK